MKGSLFETLQSWRSLSCVLGLFIVLTPGAAAENQQCKLTLTKVIDEKLVVLEDNVLQAQANQELGDQKFRISLSDISNQDAYWIASKTDGCEKSTEEGKTIIDCNGAKITLPGTDLSLAVSTEPATIEGTPEGSFRKSLTIEAASDDLDIECSFDLELQISAPFDLVFVLDHSGSMNNEVSPDKTRWQELKTAISESAGTVETLVINKDGSANWAYEGSQFGSTGFATEASDLMEMTRIEPGLKETVDDKLTDTSPAGWTAMGCGLKGGLDQLSDDTRTRALVLFTDGEQNQQPVVYADEGTRELRITGENEKCDLPVPSHIDPEVEIVTVGIDHPSGNYLSTLQHLATDGHFYAGDDINGNMQEAWIAALRGNSLQTVASVSGTLSPSSASEPPDYYPKYFMSLPFTLNHGVSQLLIKLSFDGLDLGGALRITRNGEGVDHAFEISELGDSTVLLSAEFPTAEPERDTQRPEGDYLLEIFPSASTYEDIEYRAVVLADDHRFDMDWRVEPRAPRVNQPFHPTMSLHWLGRPITPMASEIPDTRNPSIKAFVLKPGDDLGDLLARHPLELSPDQLTVPDDDNPDAGSPGYQKYLALLKDEAFLETLLPEEQQKDLEHQGDGVYSAAFDPGDVSGLYQVFYVLEAHSPDFGTIKRLARQSVYMRFGEVDLEQSMVEVKRGDGTVGIQLRPITTDGRYLGPANGSAFSVEGKNIELTDVVDNQDGSYRLTLTGNPRAKISFEILGETVYRGRAARFGSPHRCWLSRCWQRFWGRGR